jgi:hypothetical protein
MRVTSGAKVLFVLGDVVCPDLTWLFEHVGPDLCVGGEIAYLSDRGQEPDYFAIVDSAGIAVPLIVPVQRLTFWQEPGAAIRGRRNTDEGVSEAFPAW